MSLAPPLQVDADTGFDPLQRLVWTKKKAFSALARFLKGL